MVLELDLNNREEREGWLGDLGEREEGERVMDGGRERESVCVH